MSDPKCQRLWEVEAERDGRLDPQASASLARHLAACADCRREHDALEALGTRLRGLEDAPVGELALRRLKQSTLARAFGPDAPESATRPVRGWRMAALTAGAVAMIAFAFAWRHRSAEMTSRPGGEPFEIVAQSQATFATSHDGAVNRIVLTEGTLVVRVRSHPTGTRVVVAVPDGEIEDVGTVFRVVVSGGKTVEVEVMEGRVVAHLDGPTLLQLGEGQVWRRTTAVSVAPTTTAIATAPSGTCAAGPSSLGTRPAASAPDPAAGTDEDQSYLRVLDLVRQGKDDDARAAAKDYLTRFPNGFRRAEVTRIAYPR